MSPASYLIVRAFEHVFLQKGFALLTRLIRLPNVVHVAPANTVVRLRRAAPVVPVLRPAWKIRYPAWSDFRGLEEVFKIKMNNYVLFDGLLASLPSFLLLNYYLKVALKFLK